MLISQYFQSPGGSTAGFEVESPNIFTQVSRNSPSGFLIQLSVTENLSIFNCKIIIWMEWAAWESGEVNIPFSI